MMVPEKVIKKLNEQITNEFHAAHNYMAMACRFDSMGLKMLAEWFYRQGEEEREHGKKIMHYVLEVGGDVELGKIPAPKGDLSSPEAIVRAALEQEMQVTRDIHEIAQLAEEHRDFSTGSFIKWFIDEQVEEVSTTTDLLQLVELAGDAQILLVEQRVAKMLDEQHAAGGTA